MGYLMKSTDLMIQGATAPSGKRVSHADAGSFIDDQLSFNYSFAKVMAIAMVVLGHWTGSLYGLPVWIPVTFGLFLFAYSSGYFTAALYGDRVDRSRFWRRKLQRLGVRYWVILAFIAALVALQGKPILHWHSLVHVAGLSGVLNWFAIPNHSALGAGLWFFTLLLLFYIVYPYLALVARSTLGALVLLIGGFAAAVVLQEHVRVGHELWLTAYAFIAGVACRMQNVRLPAWIPGCAAIVFCAALFILNGLGIKNANTFLIALTSLMISLWLVVGRIPQWSWSRYLSRQEKYLLEIFLIHTYLFVRPTGHSLLDFFVSILLIVLASYMVGRVAESVSLRVFGKRG